VTLAADPSRWWRRAVVGLVGLWALFSAVDHVALARRYAPIAPPDDVGVVAGLLAERGVKVAEAGYWRAYKLTFVSGERVIVASTDFVRIQAYRDLANQQGPALRRVQEQPCPGGEPIGPWFLCRSGE
jgi:hypothetical protein